LLPCFPELVARFYSLLPTFRQYRQCEVELEPPWIHISAQPQLSKSGKNDVGYIPTVRDGSSKAEYQQYPDQFNGAYISNLHLFTQERAPEQDPFDQSLKSGVSLIFLLFKNFVIPTIADGEQCS